MPGPAALRLVADQLADRPVREGDHVRVGAGSLDQAAQVGRVVDHALDGHHAGRAVVDPSHRMVMCHRAPLHARRLLGQVFDRVGLALHTDGMSSEINVTYQLARDLPATQQASWRTVLVEFAAEVPNPERVEVVITDEFAKVAGQYAVLEEERSNSQMTAEQYQAEKGDGATVAAKTCALPGGQVVVARHDLAVQGTARLRHSLLHEAQHVRLHQHGDVAHAVHRRLSVALPADQITPEFLWIAESAIDEFRCERTVRERGWTDTSNATSLDDYAGALTMFLGAKQEWHRSRDVMPTYQAAFAALDRLAVVLAYGAADLATGRAAPESWAPAEEMGAVLEVLKDVPGTDVVVSRESLFDTAVTLGWRLRLIMRQYRFDCCYLEDGTKFFGVDQ